MNKTLDPNSFVPLYYQLKELLKEKIESGEWVPGDLVPSEHKLMQQFKISRNTAKKALDDLVQEGILKRVQGKGTFVSKPKIEQSLGGFYSFSKVMEAKGLRPKDVILGLEREQAKPGVAKRLQVPAGTDIIGLKRLRCAGEEPIILETSYLPQQIAPNLTISKLEENSLYDILEKDYGIFVTKAKEVFEPVLIRDYESKYLQVKGGYPALLLDRIAYEANGRVVEFCRSIVRGDRCRFYTELL